MNGLFLFYIIVSSYVTVFSEPTGPILLCFVLLHRQDPVFIQSLVILRLCHAVCKVCNIVHSGGDDQDLSECHAVAVGQRRNPLMNEQEQADRVKPPGKGTFQAKDPLVVKGFVLVIPQTAPRVRIMIFATRNSRIVAETQPATYNKILLWAMGLNRKYAPKNPTP